MTDEKAQTVAEARELLAARSVIAQLRAWAESDPMTLDDFDPSDLFYALDEYDKVVAGG